MELYYYIAPLLGGCAIALLPAINSYVSEQTKNIGFIIVTNFALGAVLSSAVYAIYYPVDIGIILEIPTWKLLGGVYGTVTVVVMTLTPAKLGVGKTLSTFIVARLTSAAIIDHFGWLSMPVVSITSLKILGVCLALAGAMFILRVKASGKQERRVLDLYLLLCVISGFSSSMQSSTNAALLNEVNSFIFITWLNFMQNILSFTLIYFLIFHRGISFSQNTKIYLLGAMSALTSMVVITMMALGSGTIGVATTVVFSIITQLTTGMIIDHFGWFRVARHVFSYKSLLGLVCLTMGAYLII